MENFWVTLDVVEQARSVQEMLGESRQDYQNGITEAQKSIRAQVAGRKRRIYLQHVCPFMNPSDVYDEDESMRDRDECANKQADIYTYL